MLFAFGENKDSYYVSHGTKNYWVGMPRSITSELDKDNPVQCVAFGEDGAWFYREAPRNGAKPYVSASIKNSYPKVHKIHKSRATILWVSFGPDGEFVLMTEDGTLHWETDILRKYKNSDRVVRMRCVSWGYDGAWVIVEDDGEVRQSQNLSKKISKALKGKDIRNVQLCTYDRDMYFIEYVDGGTDWSVPNGAGAQIGKMEEMPVRADEPGSPSSKDVSQRIIFAFGHAVDEFCVSLDGTSQWRKFDDDHLEEKLKRQGKMEAFAAGENRACFWSQGGSTWVSSGTEIAYPEVWRIWKSEEQINWVAFGPQGYYIIDTEKRIYSSRKSTILRTYKDSNNQVPLRCASFGYGGSWVVVEDDGVIRSHGLGKQVLQAVKKKSVRNVQLNVTDSENYFIEYMDGSYTYNLPRSWHDGVEKVINGTGPSNRTPSPVSSPVSSLSSVVDENHIEELDADETTFLSIVTQFEAKWLHTHKRVPRVRKVYRVTVDDSSRAAYLSYRDKLERKNKFTARDGSVGNERRRWHGTSRTCLLGDPGCTQLCTNSDCSLCNIIRSSFDLDHYGTGTGWGRFGRGHYTSATSSKSDDYAKNSGYATTSNYKTMLLNLVAVGKAFKTYDDMDDLTSPPAGYNSVIGEVGGTLNYDELVVYRNDAIIPAYLVVYS